jgi:metal-dependent hydrolase (beta-lactamase superfamily II)
MPPLFAWICKRFLLLASITHAPVKRIVEAVLKQSEGIRVIGGFHEP